MSDPLLPPLRAEDWPRLLVGDPLANGVGTRTAYMGPGKDPDTIAIWPALGMRERHVTTLRLDLRPSTPPARDGVDTAARLLALRWGMDVTGGVLWAHEWGDSHPEGPTPGEPFDLITIWTRDADGEPVVIDIRRPDGDEHASDRHALAAALAAGGDNV